MESSKGKSGRDCGCKKGDDLGKKKSAVKKEECGKKVSTKSTKDSSKSGGKGGPNSKNILKTRPKTSKLANLTCDSDDDDDDMPLKGSSGSHRHNQTKHEYSEIVQNAKKEAEKKIQAEVDKLHHLEDDVLKAKKMAKQEADKIVNDAKKAAEARQKAEDTKVALAKAAAESQKATDKSTSSESGKNSENEN